MFTYDANMNRVPVKMAMPVKAGPVSPYKNNNGDSTSKGSMPLWAWILIFVLVALVVAGIVWLFVYRKTGFGFPAKRFGVMYY
jgi:hypothetical protein